MLPGRRGLGAWPAGPITAPGGQPAARLGGAGEL